MYTAYEVDYHNRCHKLGTANTLSDAVKMERKSLKISKGEYPTFTENGSKCVTCNGKKI